MDNLVARRRARAALSRLLDVFETHGGDELAVMLVHATRLEGGLRHYGPLDVADGRRWIVEAGEELVDAGVYGAAEIVRAGRAGEAVRRLDTFVPFTGPAVDDEPEIEVTPGDADEPGAPR